MNRQPTSLKTRLYLIGTVVLAVGLGSAIFIYLTAESAAEVDWVRQAEQTKRYRRELAVYGGEMNVIAVRFSRWFEGLWHGTSLAYTVACLTLILSLGLFLVAHRLSAEPATDA